MIVGIPCAELPARMVQQDAYRPVDWRWQRAQARSSRTDRRGWKTEDFWTREAAIALRPRPWWFRPSAALASRLQRVQSALELRNGGTFPTVLRHAWILTGEPIDGIADILSEPAESLMVYEQLFFDVRDRLYAEIAILMRVIGPQPPAGRFRIAWALQKVAYLGGAEVLQAALPLLRSAWDGTEATPVRPEVRDCVATLLSDESIELTPEWLAAVQPLMHQQTRDSTRTVWQAEMSEQLMAALAQANSLSVRAGQNRTA